MYKRILIFMLCITTFSTIGFSQEYKFDPPWNTPPKSKVNFTIPGIDNVPDLYGDIVNPQLVIFFAGNQFMCIDDLLKAFKQEYPQYTRIFAETLPPGILAKQIKEGDITIGNLHIDIRPDIYTAGKSRIDEMKDFFTDTATYAFNKLAIMIAKGNPKNIKGLSDLARNDIRISMPNPQWEGIAKQIEEAYNRAGGYALKKAVMEDKVQNNTTYLTQIHHRQTPLRILNKQSDAGPVWLSEAFYQKKINHPIDYVEIPDHQNITARYMAGILKNAPHQQAAKDFLKFLTSAKAKAIYKSYGFDTAH